MGYKSDIVDHRQMWILSAVQSGGEVYVGFPAQTLQLARLFTQIILQVRGVHMQQLPLESEIIRNITHGACFVNLTIGAPSSCTQVAELDDAPLGNSGRVKVG